jgi:hypothetical protein
VHAEHVRSERSLACFAIDLARSVLAWKPFFAVKYFKPVQGRGDPQRAQSSCGFAHPCGFRAERRICAAVRVRETADDAQMQRVVSASIAGAVSPVAANGIGH